MEEEKPFSQPLQMPRKHPLYKKKKSTEQWTGCKLQPRKQRSEHKVFYEQSTKKTKQRTLSNLVYKATL